MTDKVAPKDPLRHRIYFWLMDAALISSLVVWANFILLGFTGINAFGLPEILQSILAIFLWPMVTVAPIVLFFGSPLRDEYAEQLWRRSVVVLAYTAALIPLVYFLAAWGSFFAAGQPEEPVWGFKWSVVQTSWGFAIWALWTGYIQLFVFIFQFLRWRDSR